VGRLAVVVLLGADEDPALLESPEGDVGAAGWIVDVMRKVATEVVGTLPEARPWLVDKEVMTVICAEGGEEFEALPLGVVGELDD